MTAKKKKAAMSLEERVALIEEYIFTSDAVRKKEIEHKLKGMEVGDDG
jgi:phosphopantetheine adenylyltransferase